MEGMESERGELAEIDERPEWAEDVHGFALVAESFADGGRIPGRFTCQGDELSPALAWGTPPESCRELVLVVEDPDAPAGLHTHWMVVGLAPRPGDLVEGRGTDPSDVAGARTLTNDGGKPGWSPPCPPDGRPHRYRFRLLAADAPIELPSSARRADLDRALRGHVLAEALLTGLFG